MNDITECSISDQKKRNLQFWTKFWMELVIFDGRKMTFWTRYYLCPSSYWLHNKILVQRWKLTFQWSTSTVM